MKLLLRARLLLARIDPLVALVCALLVVGAGVQAALAPARSQLERDLTAARQAARTPLPAPAPLAAAPGASDENLRRFDAILGEPRQVERQLKEVFALAERHGLSLRQGEYRSSVEPRSGLQTYQVDLPLKGSYGAIWEFALDVLRALPHASLDDVAFRRDSIGQDGVEARLRLTLHLAARRKGAP